MLQNASLLAIVAVDTEENELSKVLLILFSFHTAQGFNFHICTPALEVDQI